jgi:hypothetical protein
VRLLAVRAHDEGGDKRHMAKKKAGGKKKGGKKR